jgi:transposase InsO family protein
VSNHILILRGIGMGSLTPEIRECIVKAYRRGHRVKDIASMFDVHRWTIWKWVKLTCCHPGKKNFKDRSKKPHRRHRKITPNIEKAIILLRDSLNWGTQRIKVALMSPPPYIQYLLETTLEIIWKPIKLSRQGINNILRKNKINGSPYQKNKRDWKFFRATYPNEMWQIDIKGPFLLDGERVKALVILDDYSRYLLSVKLCSSITTEVVTEELKNCIKNYTLPDSVLSDNGSQFREQFTEWRSEPEREIDAIHAPPYYPQCKGKVERCIRTLNEEYIRLGKVFEDSQTLLEEYRDWYNNERYHMGINNCPANIYST